MVTLPTIHSEPNGFTGTGRSHVTVVTFPPLTPEQQHYARLCASVDFFQLTRMAKYMQEGLTFEDAARKYLQNKRAA